ncbi:MAG: Xaa-Pro aminopeptidase, partial [Acidobacteriota bacterium]|nr:Xaa-Pro aminopeptidase [Acidobacteriota bacterium]
FVSVARDGRFEPARNLKMLNTPAMEISPRISPDGRYFFFASTRGQFKGQPLASRVDILGLTTLLRGPGNTLGDIYQIDFSVLGIDR